MVLGLDRNGGRSIRAAEVDPEAMASLVEEIRDDGDDGGGADVEGARIRHR